MRFGHVELGVSLADAIDHNPASEITDRTALSEALSG
jgi:hypothetical protein